MSEALDKNIIILAVTKIGNELCVAGIDDSGNWIRPTTYNGDFRHFYKADIYNSNNNPIIALSNRVTLRLIHHIPQINTPHIEDWEYDRSCRPILINTLNDSERLKLFHNISEKNLDPLINNHTRSLCLIEPAEIISADFSNTSSRGECQPILKFIFNKIEYNYKVTDIYWRVVGRYLTSNKHKPILDGESLCKELGCSKFFLTIGLTRLFKETYWPMVIGVHTIPLFDIKIDYNNI